MKIDGRCHCGAITYEAEVDPDQVYVCHCTDCQAISGTTYRWAVPVPEADFRLLTGTPKAYVKRADSGATSHQHFCPDCASPIYSFSTAVATGGDEAAGEGTRTFNLRLGTARQRSQLPPKLECWCGSAQVWATVAGTGERLDRQ
jgi:hypothetical protein